MQKNYKKIYGYGLIMVVCVLVIVLIAALSENRLDGYQDKYEETMTAGQKQIELLEGEIAELSEKNSELEKRNAELEEENQEIKRMLENSQGIGSDLVTAQQAMSDLKDIYKKYKSGKVTEAKRQFGKIEPMGFDDATLSYYEVLKDLLNK